MLNGETLLWFVSTAMTVAFVAIDMRSMPESPVLKWGFILLTAYTGLIGAFLCVLGCREPLLDSMSATLRHAGVKYSAPPCTGDTRL